ncbi:MAG: T9SS type A sorting domain-containing protein [Ignavibacteria bacterium]|jgi:hypothetical protein|nr:T9SS type A sorting domain-containing protein [Ignavibacteria bacterium]MBK9227417.1 T9SS type A sorting domain-containing protein [Ignavibacteria bacterium]
MKNIIRIILAVILTANFSFSQSYEDIDRNDYKLNLTNISRTSDNSLEFDIYLLNKSSEKPALKYSLGQYFFEFNPMIANGGKLTYSIVSSSLPEALRPRNASVFENQLRLACNSISTDKAALPEITGTENGMLIVKMKLETSANKFSDEPLNLKWADNTSLLRTKIFTFDGKNSAELTNLIEFDGLKNSDSGTENLASLPTEYGLAQNYPNPFNPVTKINYEIPAAGKVTLKIYSLLGKEIATLVNERMDAGRYSASFNGADLASGMYFYKITAGDFTAVKKMVLIK